MPNCVSESFRYHTYPRFLCISRAQKNLCGGGNVASDPALPSATSRRLRAFSGTIVSFLTPPNWYCCGPSAVSLHITRDITSVEKPVRPASYLYATNGSSVFAIASIRTRLVPRYTVNCRLPEKIPIERPGKFTSRRAPSVV